MPWPTWPKVVETNPNRRRGYGLIVSKRVFWYLGDRPAIYDSDPGGQAWPEAQRYRLIWTDLTRQPSPVDWTHEREWRICGGLNLNAVSGVNVGVWWWPCVERDADCAEVFAAFPGCVNFIYSMEAGRVIPRS